MWVSSTILYVEQQAPIMGTNTAPISTGGTGTALLLDIRDAADFLGLSPWQVRGLISSGELHVVTVGRKLYFRRQTLLRWAEKTEGKHR